ncbi:MAG: hypothetical protein ABI867_04750 [Kofleriaceae bacterium]
MTWIKSSTLARCALLGAVVLAGGLALRGERAAACGGGDWFGITEVTTFDPRVLADSTTDGLYYDPYDAGYGGACGECITKAMSEDWKTYFGGAVPAADWDKLLLGASDAELAKLAGKAAAPKGYEAIGKAVAGPAKDKVIAAIAFVRLARKVEPFASFEAYTPDGQPRAKTTPPDDLIAQARAGMKTKDAFLAQRYAFQALRIAFYRRDWPAAIQVFDKNTALLVAPSNDLAWRARHYVAGALHRSGQKARANLELARIHGNYPALAGLAAQEFSPAEDRDWKDALRLAKTVRERTELWRLVGMSKDGVVAMQEIIKLDPKSNLVGLLLVRELARAESQVVERYGGKPDPKEAAAQRKAFATLEQIAISQIAKAGDKPWLMELVAGHIAAKRGDLASARARLVRAQAAQPGNIRVASQVKASLAVALVATWKMTPQYETELATSINGIDPEYGRTSALRFDVRHKLAQHYLQAGKLVEAEFLESGTVDPVNADTGKPVNKKPKWSDVAFIKDMIARTQKVASEFDRFLLKDSHVRANLEQDLAMRYVLDGDYASAAKLYQTAKPTSELFKVDPFVIHIKDCHDCDQEKYASSKWTHASFVARLAELELKAKGGGEAGAEAAIALGNAMYNVTFHGNARVVLSSGHQSTVDATAALRWYKKAFDTTKNRELKAKAAWLAAKAELGNTIAGMDASTYGSNLSAPKLWFSVMKQYANTKYYKEVLKECGRFRDWAK